MMTRKFEILESFVFAAAVTCIGGYAFHEFKMGVNDLHYCILSCGVLYALYMTFHDMKKFQWFLDSEYVLVQKMKRTCYHGYMCVNIGISIATSLLLLGFCAISLFFVDNLAESSLEYLYNTFALWFFSASFHKTFYFYRLFKIIEEKEAEDVAMKKIEGEETGAMA